MNVNEIKIADYFSVEAKIDPITHAQDKFAEAISR